MRIPIHCALGYTNFYNLKMPTARMVVKFSKKCSYNAIFRFWSHFLQKVQHFLRKCLLNIVKPKTLMNST
jgi:hypothetical protein